MKPTDYDINLADSIYQEVRFCIDSNQFSCPVQELPYCIEQRFDTEAEAREGAQTAANLVGHEVEVEVTGFWGHHGREIISTFIVQPQAPVQTAAIQLAA